MAENQAGGLETWAIVELFGHTRIAGKVMEQSIGGAAFIRLDVPEFDGQAAFTRFYGGGAIYSISPCSEEVARLAAKQIRAAPITIYTPELRALPRPRQEPEYDDGFEDDPDGA